MTTRRRPWDSDPSSSDDDADGEHGVELKLADPPRLALSVDETGALNLVEHKSKLRDEKAALARELVAVRGWTHAKVNAELNRRASIQQVTRATADQLERRLRNGESWRRRL